MFERPQYTLRRVAFFNTDITGFYTSSDFPMTANAELFFDVILNNLAWVFGAGKRFIGEFPATKVKTKPLGKANAWQCFKPFAKEFGTEFDIVTRLFPFGSSKKNLNQITVTSHKGLLSAPDLESMLSIFLLINVQLWGEGRTHVSLKLFLDKYYSIRIDRKRKSRTMLNCAAF